MKPACQTFGSVGCSRANEDEEAPERPSKSQSPFSAECAACRTEEGGGCPSGCPCHLHSLDWDEPNHPELCECVGMLFAYIDVRTHVLQYIDEQVENTVVARVTVGRNIGGMLNKKI